MAAQLDKRRSPAPIWSSVIDSATGVTLEANRRWVFSHALMTLLLVRRERRRAAQLPTAPGPSKAAASPRVRLSGLQIPADRKVLVENKFSKYVAAASQPPGVNGEGFAAE